MKIHDMRELTREEILQKKIELETELFNLRLTKDTKKPDNPLHLRILRRDIARLNTVLREDELKLKLLATPEEKKSKTGKN